MSQELSRKEKRKIAKTVAVKTTGFPHNHPLGLPKGSIRAIIVILLTVLLGTCIVIEREIPTDIGVVWVSLISYYIGHRSTISETVDN